MVRIIVRLINQVVEVASSVGTAVGCGGLVGSGIGVEVGGASKYGIPTGFPDKITAPFQTHPFNPCPIRLIYHHTPIVG